MPLKLFLRKFPSGRRVWYMRGTVHGPGDKQVPVYESTDQPPDQKGLANQIRQAREKELVEELIYGKGLRVTFAQLARDGVGEAPGYLNFEARSAGTIARVDRLIAHFADTPLTGIDQAAADEAVTQICRAGADAAPATKIRQVYGPLATLFAFGAVESRGWCAAKTFERPAVPKSDTPWLTPAQAQALIGAAAPHLKPLLVFLLCTGARLSEALDIDWKDVDLSAAHVMFRDSKAEKLNPDLQPRKASLPPAAVTAIANLPHRDGKVFRRDDGEPYADREREAGGQIRTAWATACREAGLPGAVRKVKRTTSWTPRTARKGQRYAGRLGERQVRVTLAEQFVPAVTPHDCRHSWATWFYGLTKDPLLLQFEGGWSSADMVQRYAHLMPSDQVVEIARVWGPSHPKIGALPTRAPGVLGSGAAAQTA